MIPPGKTLGILGGGQLGRMTAMAARPLGYHIQALDPDPSCAARFVVERVHTARFDDVEAARELARQCAVVTLEIETISLAVLDAVAEITPMRPSRDVLAIVQDRAAQRAWLTRAGFPQGPHRAVRSREELAAAAKELLPAGGRCFLKSASGGYDGRGQFVLTSLAQCDEAWGSLGEKPCVLEQGLDLAAELSVLVARNPRGETAVFPVARNHHESQILDWSVIPATGGAVTDALTRRAVELARDLASAIRVEGILAIELFVTRAEELFVNELAPRTHNTFHGTEVGCPTSQFEQAVRAVCDLPLGSTEPVRPAAIANLLGDLWLDGAPPAFDRALALPGVRLHLYGKNGARPGRKMGHLSAIGDTPDEAVARVLEARRALAPHR